MFLSTLAWPVLVAGWGGCAMAQGTAKGKGTDMVVTGAQAEADAGFTSLKGRRIGLITNQTGRVADGHLVDRMRRAGAQLTAIFAPEHGFRGTAEAGAKVRDGRDPATGIAVLSLYGRTRQPTADMLREVDVLVFDIQDIGARFYTYISTMGLCMQAAAASGKPFVVLDRPNPLGGDYVAGFTLEPARTSFVGQYPMPIVHGLTVGELAHMIKGEGWLTGLDTLDLKVVALRGWQRAMRWPATRLPWVATSPNIPTFESALVYPGIGVVGETLVNEGRGTATPFSLVGAPWLDAAALVAHLNAQRLPGVHFEAVRYTPRSIPNVAATPRFLDQEISGVRLTVTNVAAYQPLEVGMHVLAWLQRAAASKGIALFENYKMFHAICGTARLQTLLDQRAGGTAIIAAWQTEVARFKAQRATYLMY